VNRSTFGRERKIKVRRDIRARSRLKRGFAGIRITQIFIIWFETERKKRRGKHETS